MSAHILVVDDDKALAEMIGIVLESEGFTVSYCHHGGQAVETFQRTRPDLILLDLMLPGMDGIEICRLIRQESSVPIVMLTARLDTSDVVAGLEAGADDYIPKPFKPKELVARIKTRLRHIDDTSQEHIQVAGLEIDLAGHQIRRGSEVFNLTPLEFDLVVALARKPGRVFSREELLEQVWGYRHVADTRLVNVHVQRLRAKIERDPEHPQVIITVRGVGYRIGSGGV
ncbi:MAG: MtrAB system response regulator MtrA [Actinomycetaceae bacterium]|nr:MtrAB system response regulator MtrA [Actinomycetaceae bacterium]